MRTTKPISTISYNSPEYLAQQLEVLWHSKIISFWAFVKHLPEKDERKEHIHLYVEPAKMVQTEDFREIFNEFDPKHPDKPLTCLRWDSSKFPDWYLYAKHDKAYLAMKGQTRKYHYRDRDFITSDVDAFLNLVREINMLSISPYMAMLEAIKQGLTWSEFFSRGSIPILQVSCYEHAWDLLAREINNTYRNGKSTHTPKLNKSKSDESCENITRSTK